LAFYTGDVHPAFYPFFRARRYTTSQDEQTIQQAKESSYALVDTVFSHLNTHLHGKDYVVGKGRTIVDPYAFAMLRWGDRLPKPLQDYPHLYRFYQQFQEDAGVQQAMSQEGIQ